MRSQWEIENKLHWIRDVTFDEDRSQVRAGSGPRVMTILRNLAIGVLRLAGETNIARAALGLPEPAPDAGAAGPVSQLRLSIVHRVSWTLACPFVP